MMVSLSLALAILVIVRGGKQADDHGRRVQSETETFEFNTLVFVITGLIDLAIVVVIARLVGG